MEITVDEKGADIKSTASTPAGTRTSSRATNASTRGKKKPPKTVVMIQQNVPQNLQLSLSASLSNSVVAACKKNSLPMLKEAIKGKRVSEVIAMMNWTDRNGSTPIFHIAWSGDRNLELIEYMLHHYADPHWSNFRFNYPIDMSIETNSVEAVKLFLKNGAEITLEKWKEVKKRMLKRPNITEEDTTRMKNILKPYFIQQRRPPSHSEEQKANAGNVGFAHNKSSPETVVYVADTDKISICEDDEDDGFDQSCGKATFLDNEHKTKLTWIFEDCDVDNSLTLTKEEVIKMNKKLEPNKAKENLHRDNKKWDEDADEFMEVVDTDRTGIVSILEWFVAWESLLQNHGVEQLDEFIDDYGKSIGFRGQSC